MSVVGRFRGLALGIIAAALCSGCLKDKVGRRAPMKSELEAQLSQQCHDIGAVGDLHELKRVFDRDIAQILALSGVDNPRPNEPRIRSLAAEVSDISTRLASLARPEWTVDDKPTIFKWDILLSELPENAEITKVEIKDLILFGDEHMDLLSLIQTAKTKNGVSIRLKLDLTALSLCELQTSIGGIARVYFDDDRGAGWQDFRLRLEALEARPRNLDPVNSTAKGKK